MRGNRQIQTGRKPGRPKTTDLQGFSIKLPRDLVDTLDKAAGNSLDSRNMIIRRILQQYFGGELARHDFTPLDYSNSIDFTRPATRREVPGVFPQERFEVHQK